MSTTLHLEKHRARFTILPTSYNDENLANFITNRLLLLLLANALLILLLLINTPQLA